VRNKLGLLLLASFLVVGQEAEGDAAVIEGVVRDESGGVLPGVTVSAVADGSEGAPMVQVSDGNGFFRFDGLAPGSHRIVFSLPGFEEKSILASSAAGAAPLEVTLALATLTESVTVRAEAALVDVTQSSGENEVANEVLEAAPLSEERFQDSLPLLPSVVRGPDGLMNINGARSSQSGFLLNGANVISSSRGLRHAAGVGENVEPTLSIRENPRQKSPFQVLGPGGESLLIKEDADPLAAQRHLDGEVSSFQVAKRGP
jgi:hypothetical protein